MAVPGISQRYKLDLGLVSTALNSGVATGPYFPVAGYRKFCAICTDGASILNKVTKLEWLQAKNAAGGDAKPVKQSNISTSTESKAESTAAATVITKATEITISPTSMNNADTITINGVVYTAHTDTTDKTERQFSIAGSNTEDATALYGLLIDADYGITDLGIAVTDNTSGVLTLRAEGDRCTLTVETSNASRCPIAITKQLLYSEIDIEDLDISGGFMWVAPKVTKAGDGYVSVVVVREEGNYNPPTQHVAAGVKI